ncbi:unnamed protein product, partial [Prorocentrum cordatum]
VHVSVEVLESEGMLISNTAIEEPARIETADLFTQLGVSWLALVLSGGVFVILPRYQTLAQLLLFFGAQNFMNLLYIKAILSIHTVSQQLAGFLFLALAILVSQLTPWAYRPHTIVSKDQAFAVMALAVCFTLNIALNNFSLSLLDMSVDVIVCATSPLMSLLLQLCFPAKVGMVLLGVICAALVVISKRVKLNAIDLLIYMAIPIVVLLLLPIYLIKHPVSYPGYEMATNFSVFVEIAQLSLGTVVPVMLSGIWALGYNLLLYNIVRVAAIALALLMGMESLQAGRWKCLMCAGVAGNIAACTACSLWPPQPKKALTSLVAESRLNTPPTAGQALQVSVEAVSSGEAADELVESSIGDLNEVLAQYGKQIDESRKLNFVGSEVSISEMRSRAAAAADVEMLAVAGLNMGRSLDEHTAKQLTDDYADDCILGRACSGERQNRTPTRFWTAKIRAKVHVSVEVLESEGMLISNTAIEEPARIETADLFTQLGVSWLALVLSGGVFVILPRYQTLAQLLLFFGAQNFMNLLYIKAILSIHTVSQQLAGFLFLALAILVSQLTPWAYRPHTIVSKDQAFAVMALAVCFTLNIALNNFSLSLLDMSVDVIVCATSPLMSLLLQLCFPAKVGMVLLGVICAALVVISKSAQKKTTAQN